MGRNVHDLLPMPYSEEALAHTVARVRTVSEILERPLVERVADLIPVALLSALVAVQVFSRGHELVLDARALGLGVAVVLLLLRAPFLVVVFGAAAVAAGVRLLF